jgi:hypothetical protein
MRDDWVLSRSVTPALTQDQPWETGALLSAVALLPDPDGERLRLYYLVLHRLRPLDNLLCLALSTDGIHWDKPDLGDGSNVVMRSSGHQTSWGVFMPTRILHEASEPRPAWRWKMVYWERLAADTPAGICLAVSPDGLSWQPLHERPIVTNANDAMSMVAARAVSDTPLGAAGWYLYQQTWKHNRQLPRERDNLKQIHRCVSIWRGPQEFDGSWVGPVTVLEPDTEDPADLQHYWMVPYHTTSGYGGLLLCHHTTEQTMDVQRVASLDGWSWDRCDERQPLLRLGDRGHFDCGMVTTKAPPCSWQGRLLLPYNGRPTCHDQAQRYPGDPHVAPGIGMVELDPALLD